MLATALASIDRPVAIGSDVAEELVLVMAWLESEESCSSSDSDSDSHIGECGGGDDGDGDRG